MNQTIYTFKNAENNVETFDLKNITVLGSSCHESRQTLARSSELPSVYIGEGVNDSSDQRRVSECLEDTESLVGNSRFQSIREGLESAISYDAKKRISRIVSEIKSLSDVEKLSLYLRLPTGDTPSEELRQTPTSCIHASNRLEHGQAYTWIKSHLEEDSEICLPKQDVYEDYKQYCDIHNIRALSIADFGKLMKSVFPNVKPRRLGQRGQSRYCYGGLRKKLDIETPSLPELVISPKKEQNQKNEDDELVSASCHLVLEWASKLLGQNFSGVRELSEYLVSNLYVNSKSVAAFTVIAAMQESGMQNVKVPSLFNNTTGGDRHRETQLQLQRKLQERELLAKQKKKLQQQREENQQRLRQSHERQTPLITSPTIQQVLMSPARRIFDEARDGDAKSVTDAEILRSQSVTMFTPVSDSSNNGQIRSKSTTSVHFDVESTNMAAEPQVLESKVPVVSESQQTRKRTDSDSAMEVSQICDQEPDIPKVISRNTVHKFPTDAADRQVSNETSMEVSSPENESKTEKKSVYHTIRKPAVVKRGGIWTVPGTETECTITKVSSGTVLSSMKVGTSTCDSARKQTDTEMQEKPQISHVVDGSLKSSEKTIYVQSVNVSKPTIPQSNHEVANSHLCLKQILGTSNISSMPQLSLSTPALNNPPCNAGHSTELATKQQVISSSSSVSARSAFVPFSQVSNRKDLPCDFSETTSPSISLCGNKQKFKSMDNLTQSNSNQSQGLILKDATLISDKNSVLVLGSNPSISDFVKTTNHVNSVKPPTSIPVCLSTSNPATKPAVSSLPTESTMKSLAVDNSAVVRSNSSSVTVPTSIYVSPSPVCSSSESSSVPSSVQSSPSTPKKTKSRFTPIRPKASPAKTVSTILKENKSAALDSDKYDKSRPVAELLKEKRAREAQQQSGKPSPNASSITTSVTTPVPQLIPQQLPLGIQGGTLPVADKGNIFIILSANPAITPTTSATPISNINTPINSTINTITTCRPDISAIATKEVHSTILSSRQSRSRTNSSSEREFESPIPSRNEQLNVSDLSDHADCSPGNDEKPSKLIKIVDNECNVSSRPGSRGSIEREETPLSFLGRKRKFFNADNGNSFIVRQNSKKFDSIDDGDEEMPAVPTEALTCNSVKKNLDKTNSFDVTVSAKIGHHGSQYYPNISDLENDALLDLSDDQILLMNKPRSKVSASKNQQSTAVGVNSLSLTHQKFLKEKKMLDQRMKLFSQQREPVTASQVLPENPTSMKLQQLASEQSQNAEVEMEAESELPPDVADFITDAMTGIENTRIHSADPEKEQAMETMVSVDYSKSPIMVERHMPDGSRSASEIEQLQKIKEHLKSPHQGLATYNSVHISPSMAQDSTYQQRSHSVTFTEPEIPHSTAHINMVRSQSVTFPDATEIMTHVDIGNLGSLQRKNEINQHSRRAQHQVTSKNIGPTIKPEHQPIKEQFISPQVPLRRQRTPSVELGTNQSNSKFNSIVQPAKRIQKELSIERVISQTPFSDPGYGSVGPSPVPGTSNVLSNNGICDSTYSSMTSSHLSGRPDSAQSLASDNIAPSPVSLASPRFSTSTPYPLRSPCPTPNQAILMSPGPGENNGPIRFMPIQATTYKTNNSVTLIKPVVTVASHCLSDNRKLAPQTTEVLLPKVVSANAPIKPPPPYTAAVQQQHCKEITGTVSLTSTVLSRNADGAFILLTESNKSPPSAPTAPPSQELPLAGELPQEDPTPHFLEKHGQNAYPFSSFFAQLSRSKSTDQPVEVVVSEAEVQKDTRKQDKNEIINNILGHLKSPLSHTRRQKFNIDGSNQIMQTLTDLPNANYRGNQPNVDISGLFEEGSNQILTNPLYQDDFQMSDQVFHEDEYTAKRSLTFNDQFDLQTTLDVLKDVDSEYFQHDTFDVEGSKRQ